MENNRIPGDGGGTDRRYTRQFANPYYAAERGYIDAVIEPQQTRPVLIRTLAMAATKREARPSRKHGNIPL